MVLWRKGGNYNVKTYTIHVAPGALFPDATEFFEGGKPKQFGITFTYGKSEDLPSNLAQFLLDQGLAQETKLILP